MLQLLVELKDSHNVENDRIIDTFLPLFNEEQYKARFDTAFDMTDNIDYLFRIAYLKAGIDTEESFSYILKGINEGILRHGWRKDYIVDTNLVSAFEVLSDKGYMSRNEIIETAQNIVGMIHVLNRITDERWRGDDLARVMRVLDKIDIEESAKVLDRIVLQNSHSNDMLFEHLKTRIVRGCDIKEILEKIEFFDCNEGDGRTIVYSLGIYLHLFYSHWYLEDKKSLEDRILTIMSRNNFVSTDELETESYYLLQKFCREHDVECSVSERYNYAPTKAVMNDNTKAFIEELKKSKSKHSLDLLYEQLYDYNKNIIMDTEDVWKLLVDKTRSIYGNFDNLIDYFSKNNYPDGCSYSRNSRYMYWGLGYAIKIGIDKRKLFDFIFKKGGHDGFVQLIYSYAFIEDKEMCRKLFWRFMDICKLLVLV